MPDLIDLLDFTSKDVNISRQAAESLAFASDGLPRRGAATGGEGAGQSVPGGGGAGDPLLRVQPDAGKGCRAGAIRHPELFLPHLKDADAEVRATAAEALRFSSAKNAAAPLAAALADPAAGGKRK